MASWLSNLIFGKDPGPLKSQGAFDASTQQQGAIARDARSQYGAATAQYQAMNQGFDPQQAYRQYAQGAEGDFNVNLANQLRTLKGSDVGAGRLDTGFFDEDQGQVVQNVSRDFNNTLASGALQASGQRLSQIGQSGQFAQGQGQYAANAGQEYNDLLAGSLDRQQAEANAKRQQRSGFWSGLLGAGASVAGSLLGGKKQQPFGGGGATDLPTQRPGFYSGGSYPGGYG